ncbi:MAG: hypothetical protein RR431_11575 [Clostridia bacterium]
MEYATTYVTSFAYTKDVSAELTFIAVKKAYDLEDFEYEEAVDGSRCSLSYNDDDVYWRICRGERGG